jgi:zinc protease
MYSLAAVVLAVGLQGSIEGQVRVPKLPFKQRTLQNGLHVISLEDHSSPTVAIQVWYRVGSKDDPPGRSGFAHLFEHIMFKSTRNMKDEMMDRLTEDVGGNNNASTGDDYTNYHEVVPSNYLETLLWAEAERLSSLNVNEPNFKSERAVVQEEFRQSVLAPPYGRFFYYLDQKSFTVHPYHRPTIGSIEDLAAATLEDVRKFHQTFYRPDNAVLIVSGDFDGPQLDQWVDKYFAGIPKPGTPIPRVTVKEPARTAEKRYTEYGPNVPLPALAVNFLVSPVTGGDAPALDVLQAVLSTGDSSRLYQALVYRQQIAQEVFANADLRQDAGLFDVGVILADGKSLDAAEKSLTAELDQLKTKPVSAAELDKAKNQLITNELHQRETSEGKAFALARAAILFGDPARADTDIDRLQAVTAADVQHAAQRYFTAANRMVLRYLPESAKKTGTEAGQKKGGAK